jgi:hypothetical protein
MDYKNKSAELKQLTLELFLLTEEGSQIKSLIDLRKKLGFNRPEMYFIHRDNSTCLFVDHNYNLKLE